MRRHNALKTLKNIALTHRKKLAATFALVGLENLLFVLYLLVGSFAVNAVTQGNVAHALAYALMVAIIWAVGSVRRAVDTRAFVHIYAVITYLWAFAMSLDDMPRLVEKFSERKDIGQRVEV